MRYLFFSLSVLFCAAAIAVCGGNRELHLTGNSQVDFFGSHVMMPVAMTRADSQRVVPWKEDAPGAKSPWIAALMSLVVPGAGEAYTGNYLKGAAFFTGAAASWIVGYTYDKKGDRATDDFQFYANTHYSVTRYVNWTLDHLGTLSNGSTLPESPDQYRQSIYGNATDAQIAASGPPFSVVNWTKLNDMESDIAQSYLNGYTHQLPHWNQQQYYELIGKYSQFSRGWDDSNGNSPLETAIPIKSTSARFYLYAQMRADANHQYDVASTWVSIAVVTHIVSAIDAFWSATRYNSALHADLNMYLQPSQVGLVPVTEARVRYEF